MANIQAGFQPAPYAANYCALCIEPKYRCACVAAVATPANVDPLAWLDKYIVEQAANFNAAGITRFHIEAAAGFSELDEIERAA